MTTPDSPLEPDFWKVTWQFDGKAFEALRSMAEEVSFKAQQTIFSKGDPPDDGMYLVMEGYALVVDDDMETISIIPGGQSFGELALLIQQPRRATVIAGTDIKVLRLRTEQLTKLEMQDHQAAAVLYKKLARTLSEQLLLRADLTSKND